VRGGIPPPPPPPGGRGRGAAEGEARAAAEQRTALEGQLLRAEGHARTLEAAVQQLRAEVVAAQECAPPVADGFGGDRRTVQCRDHTGWTGASKNTHH